MFAATLPKPKPIRVLKTKKRKKVSSRTMLERRLDALVREIVLDRDGYCVCPAPKKGHVDILQCGHLITRGRHSVRYDLFNCNVQCAGCNARHEHFAELYTSWFIREFGAEKYQELVRDSEEVGKLTVEELEVLISNLTGIRRRQLDDLKWKPYFTQKQIMTGEWRNDGVIRVALSNV